jgi:membrane protease YdiL (CAAX protease family)
METTRHVAHESSPRREVLVFYALTMALAVAVVIGLPDAEGLNVVLTQLCPTVAVVVLTFTMFQRGTRRALWRSIGLSRAGVRSWRWAFGLPILASGGIFGTLLLVGAGELRALTMTGSTVVSFATGAVLLFLAGLIITMGEEIGWRGFMLPRIQQLTGRRRAAVVTGLAHGCFHLPLILIATTFNNGGSRWVVAPVTILTIAAAGVFYAWLRDRSGSVWPVAIGHTFGNTTFSWALAVVVPTTWTSLTTVAGPTGMFTLAAFATFVALALVLLRTAKVWKSVPVAITATGVDDATQERVEA